MSTPRRRILTPLHTPIARINAARSASPIRAARIKATLERTILISWSAPWWPTPSAWPSGVLVVRSSDGLVAAATATRGGGDGGGG